MFYNDFFKGKMIIDDIHIFFGNFGIMCTNNHDPIQIESNKFLLYFVSNKKVKMKVKFFVMLIRVKGFYKRF